MLQDISAFCRGYLLEYFVRRSYQLDVSDQYFMLYVSCLFVCVYFVFIYLCHEQRSKLIKQSQNLDLFILVKSVSFGEYHLESKSLAGNLILCKQLIFSLFAHFVQFCIFFEFLTSNCMIFDQFTIDIFSMFFS